MSYRGNSEGQSKRQRQSVVDDTRNEVSKLLDKLHVGWRSCSVISGRSADKNAPANGQNLGFDFSGIWVWSLIILYRHRHTVRQI